MLHVCFKVYLYCASNCPTSVITTQRQHAFFHYRVIPLGDVTITDFNAYMLLHDNTVNFMLLI